MEQPVKITIEDNNQKAFINLTPLGNGNTNVEFTFNPDLDLKAKQESPALQMAAKFMEFLSGGE